VEGSNMAQKAKMLVAHNGLDKIVEVLHSKVEHLVDVPKVDVLISEPMGSMLLSERMLESYIAARDMFLKPGGKMLPGDGTIYCAPSSLPTFHADSAIKKQFWSNSNFHGLDLTVLEAESVSDSLSLPVVDYVPPCALLAAPVSHLIDFHTATMESLKVVQIPLHFNCSRPGLVDAISCWFDVTFDGTNETSRVELSTGPFDPLTHWWQCSFLLPTPIGVNGGQILTGRLSMEAHTMQSYIITITIQLQGLPSQSAQYDLRCPNYRCRNEAGSTLPTHFEPKYRVVQPISKRERSTQQQTSSTKRTKA